ncbi:MAG: dihydroorotate dehydrogenase-like protein [Polyangiaceae bacterium]|nr:dihydroorotate dehydrogenase-like protein [Polyangiaceae bacterium]
MDLTTTYLGLNLKHPLMLGASPLCDDLDKVKQAEDAGVAAIVMHSLFEEQIKREQATAAAVATHGESSPEASSYLPTPSDFVLGPDAYLEQIRKVKAAVSCPVIGSLNGVTPGGWVEYTKQIEQAGADAIELNVYSVAHDPQRTAAEVEGRTIAMVKEVVGATALPVAVKLSPFYSSLTNLAVAIEKAGAKGLVVFNRFYQPDIDVEKLEVSQRLTLSTSNELLLRLRWLALLSGRVKLSLGVTGGVHSGIDALKTVMAGAHGVQVVSAAITNGPVVLAKMQKELETWLAEHDYESLKQGQGSMSLAKSPNAELYERGNYVKILLGYAKSML